MRLHPVKHRCHFLGYRIMGPHCRAAFLIGVLLADPDAAHAFTRARMAAVVSGVWSPGSGAL